MMSFRFRTSMAIHARSAPHLSTLSASLLATFLLTDPVSASRLATGMQIENWSNVDVELSKNPKNNSEEKIGYSALEFDVGPTMNYYLEEPGFLFSLLSGVAGTEANQVAARNEAIRKNELTYSWTYAQPAPIPEGRWVRWGYTHAFADGAKRTFNARSRTSGKDTVYSITDPNIRFDYIRFDMNLVTAPQMFGSSDFYWMFGSDMSITSVKIYGGTQSSKFSGGIQPGDDWSFMTIPFNLHLGWNPSFFPYLSLEGNGGVDIIDPIGNLFVGFKNYTPYSKIGARAALGTDWINFYTEFSHQVDPLYDGDEYNRRYSGNWSVYGVRLDLGNLFGKMMGE